MRLIATITALFLAAGPAAAQGPADWMEYTYPDHDFSVAFPTQPTIEHTTYQAPGGRTLEARVYSVTHDGGTFKMVVAELPDGTSDEKALVNHAVDAMTQGREIKLDIPHRIRAVYGRQLGIAGPGNAYAYVAVFYHKKRLYQIEGKAFVGGGQAEVDAMRFQQSLDLT
jgi:hypothetical protein